LLAASVSGAALLLTVTIGSSEENRGGIMARHPDNVEADFQSDGTILVNRLAGAPMQLIAIGEPVRQIAIYLDKDGPRNSKLGIFGYLQVGVRSGPVGDVYWLAGSFQPVRGGAWYMFAGNAGDSIGGWWDDVNGTDDWPLLCLGFTPVEWLGPCEYLLKGWS